MQNHACTRTSKSQIRRARRAARATCHGEMLGTGYALLSRGKGLGERGGKEGRRSGAAGGVGVASTGGNCTAIVFDAPSQPAPPPTTPPLTNPALLVLGASHLRRRPGRRVCHSNSQGS